MLRDLASATSNTYKLKFQIFKNGKPEEFLQIMKYFKTATYGTGTNSDTRKIQLLHTMLRRNLYKNSMPSQAKLVVPPMGI